MRSAWETRQMMRVRDLMTADVVTATPETSLKDVAELLVAHRISGLPIMDDGTLVGIVSQSDIVAFEERAEEEAFGRRRIRRRPVGKRLRTAADVMRSPAVTVEPQWSAVGAAWVMTRNDVSRLPVVYRGALVGIVTRSDLIRGFTRPDAAVREEILEEVLPSLGVSPNDVSVSVKEGFVTLCGVAEDDLQVRCLTHAVRSVVGVVDVVTDLSAVQALSARL